VAQGISIEQFEELHRDIFVEVSDKVRLLRCPRIVRHHNDGLSQFCVQPLHQPEDLAGGNTIKITGRLVRDQDCRIGYDCTAIATRCCWLLRAGTGNGRSYR